MNKRFTNTQRQKAMPCDIVQEILKARNAILTEMSIEDSKLYYDGLYREHFIAVDSNIVKYEVNKPVENEDCDLGSCVSFLMQHGNLKSDVEIHSTKYYLNQEGRYKGVCDFRNKNNDVCQIVVFCVRAEELDISIIQVLYFDGEKLCLFTPYKGNSVNVVFKTCIGDERYSNAYFELRKSVKENNGKHSIDEFLDTGLIEMIYSDGLPEDEESDEYFEKMAYGYAKFLGLSKPENAKIDYKMVFSEMKDMLS